MQAYLGWAFLTPDLPWSHLGCMEMQSQGREAGSVSACASGTNQWWETKELFPNTHASESSLNVPKKGARKLKCSWRNHLKLWS